jgi:hypothetical protein
MAASLLTPLNRALLLELCDTIKETPVREYIVFAINGIEEQTSIAAQSI